jgi:hypothetical protein
MVIEIRHSAGRDLKFREKPYYLLTQLAAVNAPGFGVSLQKIR